MLRILDRYIIREALPPFFMALLVFTFMLEIPEVIKQAERLISRGTSWSIVGRVLLTLVPQALGITIPMALLIALLIAFGRLSGDRESVALQACGVSLYRLLRPVAVLAGGATLATLYTMIVAVPQANQAFREIIFNIVSTRVEGEVKPRVFFEDFPNIVLYVREVGSVGWRDVFVADTSRPDQPTVYEARSARVVVDREKRTVHLVLQDGASHTPNATEPEKYDLTRFTSLVLSVNPDSVFPRGGLMKGDQEMTIAELQARMAELARAGERTHNQVIAIQQKFSIPAACTVFAVIGLALGVTSRRDGKLASFVLGIGVIFIYYIIMYTGRALAKGALVPAWSAMWLPNIVLGVAAVWLLARRSRWAERPITIALPLFRRATEPAAQPAARDGAAPAVASASRVVVVIRIPQFVVPRAKILDWYVAKLAAKVFGLSSAALLGLFYISSFIDLAEKLFKGTATGGLIVRFLWFATPQFVYYILPMAVLVGALVTIGALTKSSELIVMKACGISLYRIAVPLLLLAAVVGAALFAVEEQMLAYSNRRAEEIRQIIRGRTPRTLDALDRKWVVARNGDIYHYLYFDSRNDVLNGLSIYQFASRPPALVRRWYARQAVYQPASGTWRGRQGWVRDLGRSGDPIRQYSAFLAREVPVERPDYFVTEQPDADLMNYSQLDRYVTELRASGFNVVPYVVALQRKIAFPFATLIMTLIAVPFAVMTGRRGAMYGVGAGLVLAISYWTAISLFAAFGSGGLLPPVLAAWAPNLLFGAGAAYLLLTVRT